MKKYAVSYMDFFDNDLTTRIVEVDGDWKDALKEAFPRTSNDIHGDEIEEVKDNAFDQDWLFEVVEII